MSMSFCLNNIEDEDFSSCRISFSHLVTIISINNDWESSCYIGLSHGQVMRRFDKNNANK